MSGSATAEAEPATLELRGARLGAAASLNLRSGARRIALLGDWEPLFLALTGAAPLEAGSAQILGCDLGDAVACGVAGVALCDPAMPASFTVREYLEHAARLSHGSARRAQSDARQSLTELGLAELGVLPIGRLALYQKRAVGIALASLGARAVICLESPLRGLDAASVEYLTRLCARAGERQRLIVSAAPPRAPSAERAFIDASEEVFVLRSGVLAAHGTPETVFSAHARYLVTLLGNHCARLTEQLREAGCTLSEQTAPNSYGALLDPSVRLNRYLLEVPPSASADLVLDTALETGVTVLELEPLLDG